MSIISKMTKQGQRCIFWAITGFDQYGQPTYDEPVDIDCRWEDEIQEYIDKDGNQKLSKSVVYVDRNMEVGGVLLLGSLDDSGIDEENPLINEGASEIMQFCKLPNLRNTETLRTAIL